MQAKEIAQQFEAGEKEYQEETTRKHLNHPDARARKQ